MRSIGEIKVGDILVHQYGAEYKVIRIIYDATIVIQNLATNGETYTSRARIDEEFQKECDYVFDKELEELLNGE